MSVEATAAMWARRDLTSTEKLVAVRLADHADPDGGRAYPSVGRLSKDTGLSERGVQKALSRLVDKGVVTRMGLHPKWRTVQYRVILTPNVVHPEQGSPPNAEQVTPEPGAGQGRTTCTLTVKEPSGTVPAVPDAVWTYYARIKRPKEVRSIIAYDRTTISDAKAKLSEQASRWWAEYDLTASQLAIGLAAGEAGPTWMRRRETA